MPTATYNKHQQFVEDLAHKIHDLATDNVRIALTNTLPTAANEVIADITQIAYTNLASDPTSRDLTVVTSAQAAGVYTLDYADLTLTASGGAVATFRYLVLYNQDQTTPLGPLICWFDYGSAVDLADGESLDINFNASGLFTLT